MIQATNVQLSMPSFELIGLELSGHDGACPSIEIDLWKHLTSNNTSACLYVVIKSCIRLRW
jgi:hypothetical protein